MPFDFAHIFPVLLAIAGGLLLARAARNGQPSSADGSLRGRVSRDRQMWLGIAALSLSAAVQLVLARREVTNPLEGTWVIGSVDSIRTVSLEDGPALDRAISAGAMGVAKISSTGEFNWTFGQSEGGSASCQGLAAALGDRVTISTGCFVWRFSVYERMLLPDEHGTHVVLRRTRRQ